MIKYFIIFNTHGKVRLQKCYAHERPEDLQYFLKTLFQLITEQTSQSCNFFPVPSLSKDSVAVYRRYASLYFVAVIDQEESELAIFDLIHMIAEGLDSLFENASELDVLFNPEKVYLLLDEIIVGGTVIETNLKETLDAYKLHSTLKAPTS